MRRLSEIIRRREPPILPDSATVQRACVEMSKRQLDFVLVTGSDGRLLGIFTDRDATGRVLARGRNAEVAKLKGGMTALRDFSSKFG